MTRHNFRHPPKEYIHHCISLHPARQQHRTNPSKKITTVLTDYARSRLARHGVDVRDRAAVAAAVRRALAERRIVGDAAAAALEVVPDVHALVPFQVAAAARREAVDGAVLVSRQAGIPAQAATTVDARRRGSSAVRCAMNKVSG